MVIVVAAGEEDEAVGQVGEGLARVECRGFPPSINITVTILIFL